MGSITGSGISLAICYMHQQTYQLSVALTKHWVLETLLGLASSRHGQLSYLGNRQTRSLSGSILALAWYGSFMSVVNITKVRLG